jgi:hypothetical protein
VISAKFCNNGPIDRFLQLRDSCDLVKPKPDFSLVTVAKHEK